MINCDEIQSAIDKNEIKIFYSFKEEEIGDLIFLENEIGFNDSVFKSNLESDRLKLTVGPVLKIHKKSPVESKIRFNKYLNYVDLKKTYNKYILKPNETVTILTLERIALNEHYSALIIPRASLSELGIVVTPSYIEPYFDGILRLLVTNTSNSPYTLEASQKIAQCYFFKFEKPVPDKFGGQRIKDKSAFYGQTWKGILNNGKDPFPVKETPFTDSHLSNMKFKFYKVWDFLGKYSLPTTLILLLINGLVGFGIVRQQFINKFDDINTNKSAIENLRNELNDSFKLHKSEISLKKGTRIGQQTIMVSIPKENIISVLCSNDLIKWTIISENMDKSKIIFSYDNIRNEDNVINFEYAIIKELK